MNLPESPQLDDLPGAYELAERIESFFIGQVKLEHRYPPLFVVGAPRSGTTLLFLHMLNNLRFGFFPNSSKAHPMAPVSYAIQSAQHPFEPTLENKFGILEGENAPSDGWDVFNRYFPKYDLSEPAKENRFFELRNIYCYLEKAYSAPIANKNISNSVRIPYLDRIFPDALFVWIERDIYENTLSLLRARRDHVTPDEHWWCTPPPQYHDREFRDEIDRVIHQIVGINRTIEAELGRLDGKRWFHVSYPDFCKAPGEILDLIRSKYPGIDLEREKKLEVETFTRSERHLDDVEGYRKEIDAILETIS